MDPSPPNPEYALVILYIHIYIYIKPQKAQIQPVIIKQPGEIYESDELEEMCTVISLQV